jgi:hypothetical protein
MLRIPQSSGMTCALALASCASHCNGALHCPADQILHFFSTTFVTLSSDTATSPVEAGHLEFPIRGQQTVSDSSSFRLQVTLGGPVGFSWQQVLGLAIPYNKL